MAKLIPGRMPPSDGGGKFHLPVGGGVVLHANSLENLVKIVFEWRIRNNVPPGDIEDDINSYYCARWPKFCTAEASDTDPTIPHVSSEPMLNRVSRWVSTVAHAMPRGGYPLESPTEAERRAAICAACPKNGGWRGGCGGCSATTLAILQQLKQLKKTGKDGSLMGCTVGGWENGAAIWLPASTTAPSESQRTALPEACWRKSLP